MPAVDATEVFSLGAPDRRLFVEFTMHARKNDAKSTEAGRPIYEDVEYIEISIPGDKTLRVHKEVTPAIREQYGDQYRSWKTGGDQMAQTGTPLGIWAWPGITRSTVEELKFFKCYTVEQLAGLSDSNLSHLGPGYKKLRDEAADWLKAASATAPFTKMQAENEDMRARLIALEAALLQRPAEAKAAPAASASPESAPSFEERTKPMPIPAGLAADLRKAKKTGPAEASP
jgi:hypothetical protein